jgi:hypothetical protein
MYRYGFDSVRRSFDMIIVSTSVQFVSLQWMNAHSISLEHGGKETRPIDTLCVDGRTSGVCGG